VPVLTGLDIGWGDPLSLRRPGRHSQVTKTSRGPPWLVNDCQPSAGHAIAAASNPLDPLGAQASHACPTCAPSGHEYYIDSSAGILD